MDIDSGFGDVLRRLRRAALLSQEELAQRAGLTARALSNLERGRAMPRASSVRLLAEALSLTVADRRGLEAAAHTSPLPDLSSPAPPVPTQLPSDPPSFVSRDDELAVMDALMSGNGATTIGLISGMSGVGKTTLAVHWAHRVRSRFPDGQIFIDLRGYRPAGAMHAGEALSHCLHSLGWLEPHLPHDVDECGALLRRLLAERRALMILDNVAAVDQIRPLLPGSSSCVVLVTSRDALAGLVARHGAHQILLSTPAVDEAVEPLVEPLAAREVRPGQLPPDTADFTGRKHIVERLCRRLTAERERTTVPTCVVSGAAGVGKTTLAVRVAHLVREAFPDGQLYADLDGAGDTPMPPGQILGMFLRALGMLGDALPPSDTERTALLRSTLAGRQVLLVLDNAADAGQVKPLLPGAATCAVLITSRRPIITIPGADRLILDVFTTAEAVAFLARLMSGTLSGPPTAAVDGDEAFAELAALCGNLPVALRIAGARAGGGSGESPRSIADRLADQRYRLSELELDDLSVRASFELSHRLLHGRPGGAAAVQAFRRLGLLEGPDVSLDVAAQLAGEPAGAARRTLEILVHAQFLRVEPAERPDRYRMHTLVRLYARERALADEPISERHAAVQRVLHHYLTIAREAGPLVQPAVEVSPPTACPTRLHSRDEALAWFDAERAGILSALRYATAGASDDTPDDTTADTVVVAELVLALRWLFRSHGYDEQWQWALRAALRRARRCGAEDLTVGLTSELASLHYWRGDHEAHIALELENLQACRAAGNRLNEIRALNNLGAAFHRRQALGEAVDYYRRALSAARAEGSQRFEAYLLANLAAVHRDSGRHDEAIGHAIQALLLCRAAGDRHAEVDVIDDLALSYRTAGHFDEAIATYRQAITIAGELQDRPRRQVALRGLGETHLVAGDPKAARDVLEQARTDAADAGDGYGEGLVWWHLGASHAAIDEPDQARRCWQQAVRLLCEADAPEAATVEALLHTLDTQHDAPEAATPGTR